MQEQKKINILYVDDEKENLDAFTSEFRKEYNIFTSTSAKGGFDILDKNQIHIALIDQKMPDLTGVQFFEAIMPKHPYTIRMLVTGYNDIDSVIEAVNIGRIAGYIAKPWDSRELKFILDGAAKTAILEEQNHILFDKLQEETAKQQNIINAFKNYLSEEVVEQMVKGQSETLNLQGEHRVVSVMFVEVLNFEKLINGLEVTQTLILINKIYNYIYDCITRNKGFVNKLLGGGVMAIFGAPKSYTDNASNSILSGLNLLNNLNEFNKQLQVPIELAIGIHTGEGICGNAGSSLRLEYTVFGATPKIASRLCRLAKEKPNQLLISESTYLAAPETYKPQENAQEKIVEGVKIRFYSVQPRE